MKLKKFKELLKYLEDIYKQDKEIQIASDKYFNVLFPDSHPPYAWSNLDVAIDTIQFLNIELYRELLYYFFEAKNMDEATVECELGSYDFTKEKELIRYLLDAKIITK